MEQASDHFSLTKPNTKGNIFIFKVRGFALIGLRPVGLRPGRNIGVMEWWNDGFEGILSILNGLFNFYYPIFHISNIPLFQMVWILI
jgi:hypothetical protein